MKDFREKLEAYGMDYQNTMDRFMGNEKMYLKLLDMFFRDDNYQKLGNALESRDYTAAFEAAHTLKGVVGNMGLTPLYQAVCAMVEPLRTKSLHSDYQALYQTIQMEYQKVDALRKQLKGEESV